MNYRQHLAKGVAITAVVAGYAVPALAAAAPGEPAADKDTASASASDSAQAQPAENSPGDIVVTATRRNEKLSKIPISVKAFSSTEMDSLGVRDVADVARLTPGLTFGQSNTRSGNNISIRGISSLAGASTTGVYIDDTPIQTRDLGYFSANLYPSVFDLERVEVLRGPQGTLFGAGSEGGTVRFITPQPSLTSYSVYARTELSSTQGGDPSYEGGVAVGGPIIADKLGFRVSGWYRNDGGWIDRVNYRTGAVVDPNGNHQNTRVLRGSFLFSPGPDVEITASLYYQRIHANDGNQWWNVLSDPSKGIYRNGNPLNQPGTDRFFLPSLTASFSFGGMKLISNTSYFDRRSPLKLDYSVPISAVITQNPAFQFGIPGYTAVTDELDRQNNFTQEFRLQSSAAGRFNWVVGGFYSHALQRSFEGIGGANLELFTQTAFGASVPQIFGTGLLPGDYAYVNYNRALDEQAAVFANVDYEIVSGLKATAGLRYAMMKTTFSNYQAGPFNNPPSSAQNSQTSHPLTPKFGLSYQADSNSLFYASASKGYRAGGGNAPLPQAICAATLAQIGLPQAPATYKSDSVWSYEIGAKSRLFGGRLQLDGSAYYIDWRNIQIKELLPDCNFTFVSNGGKAVSKGFDLQAQIRATDNLNLGLAIGYNDSKYTETVYPGAARRTGPKSVIVTNGDTIGNPPWTIGVNARYSREVTDRLQGYLSADFTYRSHNKGLSLNLDPASLIYNPAYRNLAASTILNGRIGVSSERVDVSLFVNNILNESSPTFYFTDVTGNQLERNASPRPRTIGVTVTFRER